MNEIKKFNATIDSTSLDFSMHPVIPLINEKTEPMELTFVIEDPEGKMKPIIMSFKKDDVVEILKELQRLTPLIKCFG
jgi:hypothetical protein